MGENTRECAVGIIGVGLVGSAIAQRCHAAGYHLVGYDVAAIDAEGVEACASAVEVFSGASTVFLSLPTSEIVSDVLGEARPFLRAEHLILDTTTGDPADAESHLELVGGSGAAIVEATIAGSSDLLRKGEAPIFLGGASADIDRARAILEVLSDRLLPLGPLGAASRFKLVFNLALGLQRAVLAEALHFGEALGFDPATVLEVLQQSPAQSPVMETKGKKMVERDYDPPQARLSQHLKDVRLILDQAQLNTAQVPMSTAHLKLLETAEEFGFGALDNAAVREAFLRTDL
ncbi:MAG: NAD(P)-dependent oxidoreductase [Verrucomicrobiales bacterium]